MRQRKDRRRPAEVRWHVGGRAKSRSFIIRGLADSYRAELVRAARLGLAFDPATGEPAAWAGPRAAAVTWHEHAVADAAAHTRAGIADALAAITPALASTSAGHPPAMVLRAALYAHAYNPSRPAPPPGTETAPAGLAFPRFEPARKRPLRPRRSRRTRDQRVSRERDRHGFGCLPATPSRAYREPSSTSVAEFRNPQVSGIGMACSRSRSPSPCWPQGNTSSAAVQGPSGPHSRSR